MTGLLDIAPELAQVEVQGHQIEVHGITLGDIAALLRRFPELLELFRGGAIDGMAVAFPGLAAAVIAAGVGQMGDEAQEAAAARLSAETQSKLFSAILKLTMPGGVGPFVEGLVTAFGGSTGSTSPSSSPALPTN